MNRWALTTGVALAVWIATQSVILACCAALGALALHSELAGRRASRKHLAIEQNWPEVLDSLTSAASAGLTPIEAFADLAEIGPAQLKPFFAEASEMLDKGDSLQQVLVNLKNKLADPNSDRLFELMYLSHELGGANYLSTLKSFSAAARKQIALDGELAAKQGWVKGTAKLAVASPWVIVLMLAARPENAAAYNSASGFLVLAAGLLVCLLAYRLIHKLGQLPISPRIFA